MVLHLLGGGEAEDVDAGAFLEMLHKAREKFDYIFLDAPAGIDAGFRLCASFAARVILVTGADPASIRDARQAADKLELMGKQDVRMIVNRVDPKMVSAMSLTIDDVMDHAGLPLIGVVPEDKNHERYKIMQEACFALAAYADSVDAHFAIETGPETSAVLKRFLDGLHSTGVAVNLDPANLVMVTGDDPVGAVHNLKDYIVHTHAKDGVKLYDKAPEVIYGVVPDDAIVVDPAFEELPL